MGNLDAFWQQLEEATMKAKEAMSARQVLDLFPPVADLSVGDGFYQGDGDDLLGALYDAGWHGTDVRASYWWCLKAPDGSELTYVEGDLFAGNSMPKEAVR